MAKSNTTSVASTTSLFEYLSSMIDGEAGDFEQRRVFDELSSNDELLKKVSTYRLIGETMRSGSGDSIIAKTDFLAGIHEQIQSESVSDISLNEYLSAALDDEAEDFEQALVLEELISSEALRKKVSSYSLIGETIRSGTMSVTIADSNFLSGIQDKITSEEEYHHIELVERKKINSKTWLRPVGGFAMAASVAAIAIIGFQNYQQPASDFVTASVKEVVTSSTKTLVSNETNAVSSISEDQKQIISDEIASITTSYRHADNKTRLLLKRYVDRHMKLTSSSVFVPSVRTIAYTD